MSNKKLSEQIEGKYKIKNLEALKHWLEEMRDNDYHSERMDCEMLEYYKDLKLIVDGLSVVEKCESKKTLYEKVSYIFFLYTSLIEDCEKGEDNGLTRDKLWLKTSPVKLREILMELKEMEIKSCD